MKKETFEFVTPLSSTRVYKGQIKIEGEYWMEEGSLMFDINHVYYQYDGDNSPFILVPFPFVDWLDTSDMIAEIAFEHCKGLIEADAPDITTDLQQDAHITDLKTQNKLS